MDERRQPERDENLDELMEHDTEIRRDTAVQNALGPTGEEEEPQRELLRGEEELGEEVEDEEEREDLV